MNVLFFVMTFLMLFTLMTYGKIESFRNFSGMQAEFTRYMQSREREWINEQAKLRYQSIVATKQEKREKQQEEAADSVSKISISIFVNPKKRQQLPQVLDQYRLLLTNLIQQLYSETPFFRKAWEENPNLVASLIDAILLASEERQIKKPKELAELNFADPELNELFYKMLKGNRDPEQGHSSLLAYLTDREKFRIRVFLAPAPILRALFGKETASEIETERKRLAREVKAERLAPKEATEIFQQQFEARRKPGFGDKLLDFKVTKSQPPKIGF